METAAQGQAFMPSSDWKRRVIPAGLGLAILATIVAAALSPNIGALPAQSNCEYGTCPAGTSAPFPWWIVAVLLVIVVACVLAFLLFRRRPPAAAAPAPWEPPAGAAAGTAAGAGVGGATGGAPTSPTDPGASAAYMESPDDVGAALPAVGAGAAAGAGAGAAAGAGGAEEEPDIDSLMAELDKISGEILKKTPKPGSGGAADGAEDAGKSG